MANSQYLTLDFDNLSEIGLKKLIRAFESNGNKLVNFDSNNRVQRVDRELIKRFVMFFENGQSVAIRVNETGDIVQVKMNSTVLPIKNPRNENELAKDVSALLKRNQVAFDKSLAVKAAAVIKDESRSSTARKTATAMLNEAKEADAKAQASVELLRQQKANEQNLLLETNNQAASYRTKLESAKFVTNELMEKLKELGVTPNA